MNRSDSELRAWAHEHLTHEAGMLLHAVSRAGSAEIADADRNAFVDSFAVHVRCLRHFLWNDHRGKPGDALAKDFCPDGAWEAVRGELPDSLAEIEGERNRVGREIVHLTYHRLDVARESKDWDMTFLLRDVADALARFSRVADPSKLAEGTREALALMPGLVPGSREMEPLRGSPYLPGMSPAVVNLRSGDIRAATSAFPGFAVSDVDAD